MLKVIGPRALIQPVEISQRGPIELTDRAIPVVGRIVGLGTLRCPTCDTPLDPHVTIGALVLVPPTAGQEVTVDGEPYWIVPIEDIGAQWTDDDVAQQNDRAFRAVATEIGMELS